MLYRCIRKIDTGQWIDVLFTIDSGNFSVSEESHRSEIAAALGLPPEKLEAVDAASDQRTGALLVLPPTPEIPLSPSQTRFQDLLAVPRSSWTTAQMRELVELTAQEAVL